MLGTITLGARGSKLALVQARTVAAALTAVAPDLNIRIETISSAGDQQPETPIQSLGVGAFTSAIERALLDRRIDIAVHSLKDLPTEQPQGLIAVPVTQREDARDVLVNRWDKTLLELPQGARIGTSSPRRAAQLTHGRKNVSFLPIRGNVETRMAKSEGDDYDGVVLAAAGVRRLGMTEHVAEYLSPHVCTPAPGQAALAAEARTEDSELLSLVREIVHGPTAAAVEAERWVLRAAGSGCGVPLGAFAEVEGAQMRLFATVTPADGSMSYRVEVTGDASDPEILGKAAYRGLLEQGAGALFDTQGEASG